MNLKLPTPITAFQAQSNVTHYSHPEEDEIYECYYNYCEKPFKYDYVEPDEVKLIEKNIYNIIKLASENNYGSIEIFIPLVCRRKDVDCGQSSYIEMRSFGECGLQFYNYLLEISNIINKLRNLKYYTKIIESEREYPHKVSDKDRYFKLFISWKRTMYDPIVHKDFIDKYKKTFKEIKEDETNHIIHIKLRDNNMNDLMNKINYPTDYNSIDVICPSLKEADYLDGILKNYGYKSEIIRRGEKEEDVAVVGINLSDRQRKLNGVLVG